MPGPLSNCPTSPIPAVYCALTFSPSPGEVRTLFMTSGQKEKGSVLYFPSTVWISFSCFSSSCGSMIDASDLFPWPGLCWLNCVSFTGTFCLNIIKDDEFNMWLMRQFQRYKDVEKEKPQRSIPDWKMPAVGGGGGGGGCLSSLDQGWLHLGLPTTLGEVWGSVLMDKLSIKSILAQLCGCRYMWR